MASLTFLKFDRVIQVDDTDNEVTIQDLVNQIRDFEDELANLDYGHIANASGKQDLGGGVQVGITLELINDWRIQFEARGGDVTELMTVSGGNLVATNQYSNNPIKPSAFTQVNIAQSSSATIITPPEDLNLLYLVESLHGSHRTLGNIYYWDPTGGNDANDGLQPSTAVATFAQAHTLAQAGNHDIIFCLSNDASGVTSVTETLNITKSALKVRGPGYTFQLKPTATVSPTVNIAADNVEISGLYIETATTGTQDGIYISANNALIKDSWITNIRGNGIAIANSVRSKIQTNAIENCGLSGTGNGINIGDSVSQMLVSQNIITGSVNGAVLSGTGISDNIFENNLVYNNSAYGISIGSGVVRTGVRSGHTFSGNTSGSTLDSGTASFIEAPSGGESASTIADAVWDEVIADHITAGTTGKTLKDAKTKATLASLK